MCWYPFFVPKSCNVFVKSSRKSSRKRYMILEQRKDRSEEHTSELQSHSDLVCRLLLEKKKKYYDVHRALSAQDVCAHLAGRSTRGATLRHPHGLTRALCYYADTPDDWLQLIATALPLS